METRKLLEQGHEVLRREHAALDKTKLGHPRIGSVGIYDGTDVYGVCHRKALARQLGYDTPIEFSQEILFKAGEANEVTWERVLAAARRHEDCGWKGKLLSPDEIAIKATIEGVPLELLGRPDLVLADENGVPIKGIELKGIFGYTTAVSVFFENTPKNENLIQAAAYSYFKQLPYELTYTCGIWVSMKPWDAKTYGAKNIKPFYRVFHMEWRDDVLWYRPEFAADWVETNITPDRIKSYYQYIEQMKQTKSLGPRPTSNYVSGKTDRWGPNGMCGLCEWAPYCNRYDLDSDYDAWIAAIAAE